MHYYEKILTHQRIKNRLKRMEKPEYILTCMLITCDLTEAALQDKHAEHVRHCIEVGRKFAAGQISGVQRDQEAMDALEYMKDHIDDKITALAYFSITGMHPLRAKDFAKAQGVPEDKIDAILTKYGVNEK